MLKKQEGFTLVEVLATVFLSALVVGVLFTVVTNFHEVLLFAEDNIDMQREHRVIKERLGRYIRNSRDINDSILGPKINLKGYEPAKEEEIIIFELGGDLFYQWRDDGNPSGNPIQINSADNEISFFDFKIDDDKRWVKIKCTIENNDKEYNFTEKFYRRNPTD